MADLLACSTVEFAGKSDGDGDQARFVDDGGEKWGAVASRRAGANEFATNLVSSARD